MLVKIVKCWTSQGGVWLVYCARMNSLSLRLLLLFNMSLLGFRIEEIFYLQVAFQVLFTIALSIEFEIKLDDSYLTYRLLFINTQLYKKVIYPNQIPRIKFIRVNWVSRGAVIKVKKGLTIRVTNLVPDTLIVRLIDFAHANDISIVKTKDFLILEKWNL